MVSENDHQERQGNSEREYLRQILLLFLKIFDRPSMAGAWTGIGFSSVPGSGQILWSNPK